MSALRGPTTTAEEAERLNSAGQSQPQRKSSEVPSPVRVRPRGGTIGYYRTDGTSGPAGTAAAGYPASSAATRLPTTAAHPVVPTPPRAPRSARGPAVPRALRALLLSGGNVFDAALENAFAAVSVAATFTPGARAGKYAGGGLKDTARGLVQDGATPADPQWWSAPRALLAPPVRLAGGSDVVPAHRSRALTEQPAPGFGPTGGRELHVHHYLDGREIALSTVRNLDDDELWGWR